MIDVYIFFAVLGLMLYIWGLTSLLTRGEWYMRGLGAIAFALLLTIEIALLRRFM